MGGLSGRRLEIGTDPSPELENLEIVVDEHPGRRIATEQNPVRFLLKVTRLWRGRRCPSGGGSRPVSFGHREWVVSHGRLLLCIDPVTAIHRFEQIRVLTNGLGSSEDEKAGCVERVMERSQDALLQRGCEIDQHVAAADDVEVGKRRIGGHVLPREDAGVTERPVDPVDVILALEKASQAGG